MPNDLENAVKGITPKQISDSSQQFMDEFIKEKDKIIKSMQMLANIEANEQANLKSIFAKSQWENFLNQLEQARQKASSRGQNSELTANLDLEFAKAANELLNQVETSFPDQKERVNHYRALIKSDLTEKEINLDNLSPADLEKKHGVNMSFDNWFLGYDSYDNTERALSIIDQHCKEHPEFTTQEKNQCKIEMMNVLLNQTQDTRLKTELASRAKEAGYAIYQHGNGPYFFYKKDNIEHAEALCETKKNKSSVMQDMLSSLASLNTTGANLDGLLQLLNDESVISKNVNVSDVCDRLTHIMQTNPTYLSNMLQGALGTLKLGNSGNLTEPTKLESDDLEAPESPSSPRL